MIKNKKLFIKAIQTCLFSGGGDPTPESVWAVNELLDFYEAESGHEIGLRVTEIDLENYEEIIESIKSHEPKTSEIYLGHVKNHGWDTVAQELKLPKDKRDEYFKYGEYGNATLIIDENLNIIGGKCEKGF